jgi:hypothetical protein
MRSLLIAVAMLVVLNTAAETETEQMLPEFPQQQTARDLLTACASSTISNLGRARRMYCAGFVSGVEEAIRFKSQLLGADIRICPVSGITAQQFADAYLKYANTHPKELDKPAVEVVFEALKHAYPCP